jgi:ryanodine receptor 2
MTTAIDNLKSLLAFGYHIGIEKETDERRLKYMKLPNLYVQSNGYKPQPLDLSNIIVSSKMDDLIEILAENTHNVWAEARIKDGFTYGVSDVSTDFHSRDTTENLFFFLFLESSSKTKSSFTSIFNN